MKKYNEETFQTLGREVLKATTDVSVTDANRIELFTAILEDVYRDGKAYGQCKAVEDFTHDILLVIVKHDEGDITHDLEAVIADYEEYEED